MRECSKGDGIKVSRVLTCWRCGEVRWEKGYNVKSLTLRVVWPLAQQPRDADGVVLPFPSSVINSMQCGLSICGGSLLIDGSLIVKVRLVPWTS